MKRQAEDGSSSRESPHFSGQPYSVAGTHRTLEGPHQSPPKQGLLESGAIKAARSPAPHQGSRCAASLGLAMALLHRSCPPASKPLCTGAFISSHVRRRESLLGVVLEDALHQGQGLSLLLGCRGRRGAHLASLHLAAGLPSPSEVVSEHCGLLGSWKW